MSKGAHSNLYQRYLWLVELIYRRKLISKREIRKAWSNNFFLNHSGENFPDRTFKSHREAIEDLFNIKIICEKRAPYCYYIKNHEDIAFNELQKWLIESFSVNQLIHENKALKDRILFEETPSGQIYLLPITEAMRHGKVLEITYQSFWRTHDTTFLIEPYCVRLFRQRWYCVARSVYTDEVKIYALDRVLHLETTDTQFPFPQDFDASDYFHAIFGVSRGDANNPELVQVKVKNGQAAYFRSLPLHHSQKEVETTNEYTVFSYFLYPNYEFTHELLSHGAAVEVLSPESLREEMKQIIFEMNQIYIQ